MLPVELVDQLEELARQRRAHVFAPVSVVESGELDASEAAWFGLYGLEGL